MPEKEIATNSEAILDKRGSLPYRAWPLHDCQATRLLEIDAARQLPPHTLMEMAGLAVAKLLMAIAPHARTIWIPCGPGNNGGDGLVAARILREWGKLPVVTCLSNRPPAHPDAVAALDSAVQCDVTFLSEPPAQFDACIDALFGIGLMRTPDARCADWIARINQCRGPVLAVDVPSGLDPDTGLTTTPHVKASVTLSLLSLKPGLFTLDGRDACGDIWFNTLDAHAPSGAGAELNTAPPTSTRRHNSHKGSYGDVVIVGGAQGMTGAAQLAASAALHAGAGRVYVVLLDTADVHKIPVQPEFMMRDLSDIDLRLMTVVAGCGGGDAITPYLATLLTAAGKLVLDADALNAIARSPDLHRLTHSRTTGSTVMTPHPLEAARLLGTDTPSVQANRLDSAHRLAHVFNSTVVLKGSGSIIAAPNRLARINPTGNARLASPGTGDVLAGLVGALMAAGEDAFNAACGATFRHGLAADRWTGPENLTAQSLSARL